MLPRRPVAVLLAACLAGLSAAPPASAAITATGDVQPAYNAQYNWYTIDPLYVGKTSDGTLFVDNTYAIISPSAYLGYDAAATGTVTLSGAGTEWENRGQLYAGYAGNGILRIEDGARVEVSEGTILGDGPGATGTISISGGTLTTRTNTILGNNLNAAGVLSVSAGGSLTTESHTSLGYDAGGSGTLTVDGTGSRWVSEKIAFVGRYGTGLLDITQGGAVEVQDDLRIGSEPGSSGTVNVSGAGSELLLLQNLYLGHDGSGVLNITDGGTVNATGNAVYLSDNAGASAIMTVSGIGSQWISDSRFYVGYGGNAMLTVEAGAAVQGDGPASISDNSVALVTGTGSQWTIGEKLDIGPLTSGTLRIEDGGLVSVASDVTLRRSQLSTVTGQGSRWQIAGDLIIGEYYDSVLTIADGGVVSVAGTTINDARGDAVARITFDGGTLDTAGLFFSANDLTGTGTINTASVVGDFDMVFNPGNALTQQATLNALPGQNIAINIDASGGGSGVMGAGFDATGSLTIEGGAQIDNREGYLGVNAGSEGTATVRGAGTRWNIAETLRVGDSGTGTLNISDGAVVTSANATIGQAEFSEGVVTISGAGSTWENAGVLRVGSSGHGTLNITDGGVLNNLGDAVLGYFYHRSSGTATVSGPGSQWNNTGFLSVGDYESATLVIDNGGLVTSVAARITGVSEVTVTGAGSRWEIDDSLSVGGSRGAGNLMIESGGVVETGGDVFVGGVFTGGMAISGADSRWNIGGDLRFGTSGTPRITIENGAVVDVDGDTIANREGSDAAIHFDGGRLYTTSLAIAPSALTGTGTINTATLIADMDLTFSPANNMYQFARLRTLSSQNINFNINAGQSTSTGVMGAGYETTGSVTFEAGAVVYSGTGYLGVKPASDGTATVTGEGSRWDNAGDFFVGLEGTGVLNITDGAVVSNAGDGYVGDESGSNGTIHVAGAGSRWDQLGELRIGSSGTGALNLSQGAQATSGKTHIAYDRSSSIGSVIVADGAQWTVQDRLWVGEHGAGRLDVINGGVVLTHGQTNIGQSTGSSGDVNISGAGSRWEIDGRLDASRNASLTIEDGGVVINSDDATLAQSNGVATATVTGQGAQWRVGGDLHIAWSGTGTLNIDNGGEVVVDGVTAINAGPGQGQGLIQFNGGTLDTNSLLAPASSLMGTGTIKLKSFISDYDVVYNPDNGPTPQASLDALPGQDITLIIDTSDPSSTGTIGAGFSAQGSLLIENGAVLQSAEGSIGYQPQAQGVVTVTDPGSRWDIAGNLHVGHEGTGTLMIDNGGVVSNDEAFVGYEPGSVGSVAVSGAGSQWNSADTVYLGGDGTGELTISGGGVVNSEGNLIARQTTTVSVAGTGSQLNIAEDAVLFQGSFDVTNGGVFYTGDLVELINADAVVTGPGSQWDIGRHLEIAAHSYSQGSLRIDNAGVVNTQYVTLGQHATSQGMLSISGQGSQLNNEINLFVGYSSGGGALTVEQGATLVNGGWAYVGYSNGSSGALTVTGVGSRFDNAGTMELRAGLSNVLNVADGGVVDIDGYLYVSGTVNVDGAGSSLTHAGNMVVGRRGTGAVSFTNGATIFSNDHVYLAVRSQSQSSSPTADATVDGIGTRWDIDGTLGVGGGGNATLSILNGAVVNNGESIQPTDDDSPHHFNPSAYLNEGFSAPGVVTVDGAGSQWNNARDLTIGLDQAATLNIRNGAAVTSDGITVIGSGAGTGAIQFDNAALNTGGLLADNDSLAGVGTINTHSVVGDFDMTFNAGTGPQQQVTLDAMPGQNITINYDHNQPVFVENDAFLGAGYAAAGSITIEDGVALTTAYGYLGYLAGSHGTATVADAGSAWNITDTLFVGYQGSGTLNVENGGAVNSVTAHVGWDAQQPSAVVLDGVGSQWNNAEDLSIGSGAPGTLTIQNGAAMTNDGYVSIAGYNGSSSAVLIDGVGSAWNTNGHLVVGVYSIGTLDIQNGGVVNSTDTTIGWYDNEFTTEVDAVGTATVDGPATRWNNAGDLVVARDGVGTLNIQNLAVVDVAGNTLIATGTGTGTVHLDDGTLNTAGLLTGVDTFTGTGAINTNGLVGDWDLTLNPSTSLLQQMTFNASPGQDVTLTIDLRSTTDSAVLGAGYAGSSTLTIAGGVQVDTAEGYLGYKPEAIGTATLSNPGTAWRVAEDLFVGYQGAGVLNIDPAASVEAGHLSVGEMAGANGSVTASGFGTTLNLTDGLTVGNAGTGALNIRNGAVATQLTNNDEAVIGAGRYATGSVTVDGFGSQLNLSRNLFVGREGAAYLIIQNGAIVRHSNSFAAAWIGELAHSAGTVVVTGSGSAWENLNGLAVGEAGTGLLNIADQGRVTVDGRTVVGEAGDIILNNGTLQTTSLLAAPQALKGAGTINTQGLVSDVDLVYDATHGLDQTITHPDLLGGLTLNVSLAENPGSTHGAGHLGQGSITLKDGVTLRHAYGRLGERPGSHGTAWVTGDGSTWDMGSGLLVGVGGQGTLTIENGGHVDSGTLSRIGQETGSIGTVTVTGEGSRWDNKRQFEIGYAGTGRLNIEDGGFVTTNWAQGSYISIGVEPDANGLVTVTGEGSQWVMHKNLYVGLEGYGSLQVLDGGGVTGSGWAGIGTAEGATGVATVAGTGSTWIVGDNNEELYVGGRGDGTLNVQDGGAVKVAGWLSIGYYEGSTGNVNVTGQGSWLDITSNMSIGSGGSGELTITDGGLVSVGVSHISLDTDDNDNGFINIATGGMLAIRSETDGSLDAFFELTHDNGTDAIRFWSSDQDDWVSLDTTTDPALYSLMYYTDPTGALFGDFDAQGYTVLTVGTAPLLGDTDGDGDVDDADLGTAFANYTGPITAGGMTAAQGDIDGDGDVDDADLGALFAGYTGPLQSTSIPGDTDGDGDVDDADLGTAFANYTGPISAGGMTAAQGDIDGDGDVDDADLGVLFAGYTGPLSTASVPEPATVLLVGIGGLALARRQRRAMK